MPKQSKIWPGKIGTIIDFARKSCWVCFLTAAGWRAGNLINPITCFSLCPPPVQCLNRSQWALPVFKCEFQIFTVLNFNGFETKIVFRTQIFPEFRSWWALADLNCSMRSGARGWSVALFTRDTIPWGGPSKASAQANKITKLYIHTHIYIYT